MFGGLLADKSLVLTGLMGQREQKAVLQGKHYNFKSIVEHKMFITESYWFGSCHPTQTLSI